MSKKEAAQSRGVGLDLGTMNIVAGRQVGSEIEFTRMRDAFLAMDPSAKKRLNPVGASFVERDGELLLLGDAALEIAATFGKEVRRPLSAGLIAAGEIDSAEVLGIMIQHVLGKPLEEDEVCYFSVPAAPVDGEGQDVIYHRRMLQQLVSDCGYDAIPSNEAMAIIFAECAEETFSGLSLSWGAGMVNVALAIHAIDGLTFSIARGGDWIDRQSARSLGSRASRMCSIKERGLDLTAAKTREEKALQFYYEDLIEYALDQVAQQFQAIHGQFDVPRPIPLVLSGGTSLAGGFLEFFKKTFEKRRSRFPIEISEVRHAADPLNAVSKGLLIQALQEYDDEE